MYTVSIDSVITILQLETNLTSSAIKLVKEKLYEHVGAMDSMQNQFDREPSDPELKKAYNRGFSAESRSHDDW